VEADSELVEGALVEGALAELAVPVELVELVELELLPPHAASVSARAPAHAVSAAVCMLRFADRLGICL
jgi:hypothetical protein